MKSIFLSEGMNERNESSNNSHLFSHRTFQSFSVALMVPAVFSVLSRVTYQLPTECFPLKFCFLLPYIVLNSLKLIILAQLWAYREVARIVQMILMHPLPRLSKCSHFLTFVLCLFPVCLLCRCSDPFESTLKIRFLFTAKYLISIS